MKNDKQPRILLVDDDPGLLRLLTMRLEAAGYDVFTSPNGKDALGKVHMIRPDLVITDVRMDQMDGLELFRSIRKLAPCLPVIMITAHGSIPEAVSATQEGVFSFIAKPIDRKELFTAIRKALKVTGGLQTGATHTDGDWCSRVITRSQNMKDVLKKARLVAESDVAILLEGESGTGKELLGRAIHRASSRKDGPFVVINCADLTPTMFEAIFQDASGGTLFLKELAELSQASQARLATLLQEASYQSSEVIAARRMNFRIISSTRRDLKAAMENELFREDLFYRLNVVSFVLPPLDQRREDIAPLAKSFLNRISSSRSSFVADFAPETLEYLVKAAWPGNIRQLYNVVEKLVALCTSPIIPLSLVDKAVESEAIQPQSFAEARSTFEREYLIKLLQMAEGNVSQAARNAKRNRTDFYKLLARNNIEPAMIKKEALGC